MKEKGREFQNHYLNQPTDQRTGVELMATVLAYQYHVGMDDIKQRFRRRTGARSIPRGLHGPEFRRWNREVEDRRARFFHDARTEYQVPSEMLQKEIQRAARERDRHSMEWMRAQLDLLWEKAHRDHLREVGREGDHRQNTQTNGGKNGNQTQDADDDGPYRM